MKRLFYGLLSLSAISYYLERLRGHTRNPDAFWDHWRNARLEKELHQIRKRVRVLERELARNEKV